MSSEIITPFKTDYLKGNIYDKKLNDSINSKNKTIEECSELLQEFAERFYSGKDDEINPSFLEMEEITNGSME